MAIYVRAFFVSYIRQAVLRAGGMHVIRTTVKQKSAMLARADIYRAMDSEQQCCKLTVVSQRIGKGIFLYPIVYL